MPPKPFGNRETNNLVFMLLMLGMNLGVKLYFRAEKREEKMNKLHQENLNAQLQYLKYQVNPHFFMNTLNNIHALVDIDPEQAKEELFSQDDKTFQSAFAHSITAANPPLRTMLMVMV